VGDPTALILVYAEFQPDMSGHFLRYQLRGESVVRQAVDARSVEEAMSRLWQFTCEQSPAQCWRGIHYLVDDGAVTIRLLYDEQVDDRALWEKDVEVTGEYFPGLPVVPVT
jgi:hypothetical protein